MRSWFEATKVRAHEQLVVDCSDRQLKRGQNRSVSVASPTRDAQWGQPALRPPHPDLLMTAGTYPGCGRWHFPETHEPVSCSEAVDLG